MWELDHLMAAANKRLKANEADNTADLCNKTFTTTKCQNGRCLYVKMDAITKQHCRDNVTIKICTQSPQLLDGKYQHTVTHHETIQPGKIIKLSSCKQKVNTNKQEHT